MINAKDVLELGKKREIISESSSSGGGGGGGGAGDGGNVAKQSSLDDDNNQASRMPMSYDHSISSANPSSMEIESSGSSVAKDVERSVTTPIQYSSVEVVDMQVSGSEGGGSGNDASNEPDMHQSNLQQMATGSMHLENVSDQIISMEQQPQQHMAPDNNQVTLNQDGNHNVSPSLQGLVAHNNNNNNNDGQSSTTHNDQNAASSAITVPQSLVSPNEQFRIQEPPSKNSFSFLLRHSFFHTLFHS